MLPRIRIRSPAAILVKRAAADEIGAFAEVFRGAYEDQAFYAKLCAGEEVK